MILPSGFEVHLSTGIVYRAGADCPDDALKTHGVYDVVKAWNAKVAAAVASGNVTQDQAVAMQGSDLQAIVDAAAAQAKSTTKPATAPAASGSGS